MKVQECMCKQVVCVNPEDTVTSAAKLMGEHHIGSIPVCGKDGKLVGMVTDRDIVLRSIACGKDSNQTPISDIMTTKIIRTSPDTDTTAVAKIMADNQVRRIPVVMDEKVVGMITLGNLAQFHCVTDECLSNTIECVCHTKGQDVKNAE